MTYSSQSSLVSLEILKATYLTQLIDNLNAFSIHDHSGSLGEGASLLQAGSSASAIGGERPYRLEYGTEFANASYIIVARSTCLPRGNQVKMGYDPLNPITPSRGVSIAHRIPDGQYKLEFYYLTSPSEGVMTVYAGGSIVAEIDQYSASVITTKGSASFRVSNITGSTVVSTCWLLSSSKNPSSGGCRINIGPISVRWVGS